MRLSRSLFLVSLFFLVGFTPPGPNPALTKWIITPESSLRVAGSTNIDQFSCVITTYHRPDTLTLYQHEAASPIRITGSLVLDVNDFDCHNPVMTANLRKTLRAKSFPQLIIKFVNFSRHPAYRNKAEALQGVVTIALAGVTKRFEVDYRLQPAAGNAFTLVGTQQVKFSDFHIIPPRKLGGMIQTHNELDVRFSLKVKILD
jgi:hypothetical protein